ncbi:MAG: hypothetical protein ACR2PM_20910 [Hyphomicrobiales bacterium]
MTVLQRAALYFTAAALGGLAVVLTVWAFGQIGIADLFGVAIKPELAKGLIYKQMVWGGIWGLIFLLPIPIRPLWLKGLVMTLAPVAVALTVLLPGAGRGFLGKELGALTPVYIYLVNIPWGLVTAYLGRELKADR